MTRKQKYIIGGYLGLLAFFLIFRWMNRSIENQFNGQREGVAAALPKAAPVQLLPSSSPEETSRLAMLQTADLSPYRILPQTNGLYMNNQSFWDAMTRKAMQDSENAGHLSLEEVYSGMNVSPMQYQTQIQRIENRIREYEERITKNSDNHYDQLKLRDLYMLKSSMNALKPMIVQKK